jgi:hypothetical protein
VSTLGYQITKRTSYPFSSSYLPYLFPSPLLLSLFFPSLPLLPSPPFPSLTFLLSLSILFYLSNYLSEILLKQTLFVLDLLIYTLMELVEQKR